MIGDLSLFFVTLTVFIFGTNIFFILKGFSFWILYGGLILALFLVNRQAKSYCSCFSMFSNWE